MKQAAITEVSIDAKTRLCIRPKGGDFTFVYRAGMEVGWDEANRVLFGGVPREWSYQRWFEQILAAAEGECGVRLKLTPSTVWTDVPPEVRSMIEGKAPDE